MGRPVVHFEIGCRSEARTAKLFRELFDWDTHEKGPATLVGRGPLLIQKGNCESLSAINGSSPGPTLRWREGETVTIAVTNHLQVETSLHWHGVRVPAAMDGVPGLSYAGVAPGETFVYLIPVRQNGTYWYQSWRNHMFV